MRVSKLGNLVIAAVVVLPLSLVVACSDDPVAPPAPKPVQTCPATIAETSGASCFDSAITCDFPLACQAGFDQQVRCPCNGTTFACEYRGEPVAKGQAPECKPTTGVEPATCPASLAATEGKSCSATGQICGFLGNKCADGTNASDTCVCAQSDGGFIFSCSTRRCPGDGGVAPRPDAGGDAGDAG